MTDTLSRKHRLKQQQVEQQFARIQGATQYGAQTHDNERGSIEFRDHLRGSTKTCSGSRRLRERMVAVGDDDNDDDDDDDDDDDYSVFKVVEVGTNTYQVGEREDEINFCPATRRPQLNSLKRQNQRQDNQQQHPRAKLNSSSGQAKNFKGDVSNSVKTSSHSRGQIERRSKKAITKLYDERNDEADDCNHHTWQADCSMYDVSALPSRAPKSSHRLTRERTSGQATNNNNNNNNNSGSSSIGGCGASNHYQSKSLSTLNGSLTTKSVGGNSSSGFSSSNGSYSSQQPLFQHHRRSIYRENDCVAQVRQHPNSFYGHERGMGKRSKLIDDLDRLLMPPSEVSNRNDRSISNKDSRRRSSLVSPTESHISTATTSSLLQSAEAPHKVAPNFITDRAAANEFDYSTLCRDEFSSFIAIEKPVPDKVRPTDPDHPSEANDSAMGGPMLVGVHETDTGDSYPGRYNFLPDMTSNTSQSADSDELEVYQQFRQSSQEDLDDGFENVYEEIPAASSLDPSSSASDRSSLAPVMSGSSPSCGSSEEAENSSCSPIVCQNYTPDLMSYDDCDKSSLELVMAGTDDSMSNLEALPAINQSDKCDKLSKLLDIYVERVNCLIRLAESHGSVSIQEAFVGQQESACGGGYYFEVGAEHRTPVASVAHIGGRQNSMRIIQEVEYELEPDATAADRGQTFVTRVEQQQDRPSLKSILESIQTSPELCWQENVCDDLVYDLVNGGGRKKRSLDIRSLEESLASRFGAPEDSSYHASVSIIKEHIKEFIENYHTYQVELNHKTSFGDGSWHENWLFASKLQSTNCDQQSSYGSQGSRFHLEVSNAKRPKFSNNNQSGEPKWRQEPIEAEQEGQEVCQRADLIKYSTLILAKYKPVKLALMADHDNNKDSHHHYHRHQSEQQPLKGHSDISNHIESLYEAQLERVSELELVAIESSRQTDVCRLLLCDTDDDDDCGDGDTMDSNNNNSKKKKKKANPFQENKSLLVSYDGTSLMPGLHNANKFYFTASGYLFQTNLIKFPVVSSKLRAKLERKILEKLIFCIGKQSLLSQEERTANMTTRATRLLVKKAESESARFVISLSNIELTNRLPVIQFCAKISGSLPIRVRWYRQMAALTTGQSHNQQQYEELSDITVAKRRNLNIRSVADRHSEWPIELQAVYDYEYETPSASWYRFARNKDEIMFEIREPSLETDYDRVYKCSIENVCSREECKFQLTAKKIVNSTAPTCDLELPANRSTRSAVKTEEGPALLRTWSQRTLNKPQPVEPKEPTDAERQRHRTNNETCFGVAGATCRQQTVGHLSAWSVNEDKFDKNFPYHPENLLKRLEENKFSIPAKRKLVAAPPATMNDCRLATNEIPAQPAWSDPKVLIADGVETYFPKQADKQPAPTNSHCNTDLNCKLQAHPESAELESHRSPLANSANIGNGQEDIECLRGQERRADAEKVHARFLDRPRAVINPQLSGKADLVDDSAGMQQASKLVRTGQEKHPPMSESDHHHRTPTRNSLGQPQSQQPRPRLRLSQLGANSSKEEDQKENFRSSEQVHIGTNQELVVISQSPKGSGADSSLSGADGGPNLYQHDHSAVAKSTGDGGTKVPSQVSNHRKPGSNVKSLISRFSSA